MSPPDERGDRVRHSVDVDQTRQEIRDMFRKWDVDRSEFEIEWQEADFNRRLPGVTVRYQRKGQMQSVSCFTFQSRAENLRQVYMLLDRLRLAEDHGVQYQGLTSSKEIAQTQPSVNRNQEVLDAYDLLGVAPDDPMDMVTAIYQKKAQFFHPDKGGDEQKMVKLTAA